VEYVRAFCGGALAFLPTPTTRARRLSVSIGTRSGSWP